MLMAWSENLRSVAPGSTVFKHSIQYGEQLTHASSKGHFLGFSCGAETLIEVPDDGIMARGHQGSHIEGSSNWGTSSPDTAFASQGTTVPVKRCNAYQSSYLSTVQTAQFRKFGQKGG